MGLGRGTNNFVELAVLNLLLCFALEKNCTQLQIFGGSMVVINWINKVHKCHNILVNALIDETMRHLRNFDSFSYRHVYMERNVKANELSKKGLSIPHGQWKIVEYQNDTFHEYYHRPFIDKLAQLFLD